MGGWGPKAPLKDEWVGSADALEGRKSGRLCFERWAAEWVGRCRKLVWAAGQAGRVCTHMPRGGEGRDGRR